MPAKTPLRRRIAPSVPFTLICTDNEGKKIEQPFLLCMDVDALTALEEKVPELNTLNWGGLEIFRRMNATILRAALWAAVLRHHPEYDTADGGKPTDEGLSAIGSLVDSGNAGDVAKAIEEAYLATLSKERADEIRAFANKKEDDAPDPMKAAENPAASSSPGQPSGLSADMTSDLPMAKSAG